MHQFSPTRHDPARPHTTPLDLNIVVSNVNGVHWGGGFRRLFFVFQVVDHGGQTDARVGFPDNNKNTHDLSPIVFLTE